MRAPRLSRQHFELYRLVHALAFPSRAHDGRPVCTWGQERLAARLGVSARTLRRLLADLREPGGDERHPGVKPAGMRLGWLTVEVRDRAGPPTGGRLFGGDRYVLGLTLAELGELEEAAGFRRSDRRDTTDEAAIEAAGGVSAGQTGGTPSGATVTGGTPRNGASPQVRPEGHSERCPSITTSPKDVVILGGETGDRAAPAPSQAPAPRSGEEEARYRAAMDTAVAALASPPALAPARDREAEEAERARLLAALERTMAPGELEEYLAGRAAARDVAPASPPATRPAPPVDGPGSQPWLGNVVEGGAADDEHQADVDGHDQAGEVLAAAGRAAG